MATWSESSIKGRPVVVLGGGVLGRRIACTWAAGGWNVIIRDPSEEQRNAALHYIEQNVDEYAKTTGKTPGKASATDDLAAAVKDAWTVIEAVPEKLQLKIDTFADLDKLSPKDCLLCSNSSSYKSSEMLDKVQGEGRKRILNTHYMMPPDNRIVELMTDGETDSDAFPFLVERLKEVGMHPIVAKRESTGFVFNRLWAAIKRETLSILAEGVSTPEELDAVWVEMYGGGKGFGPCAMMDAVGLDTVAFIEEHYVKERHLSGENTVDFLKKNYLDQGKLGAKSGKGGLYPAGNNVKPKDDKSHHDNIHAPTLYFLDIGLLGKDDPLHSGRILTGSADGRPIKTLVSGETLPDGLDLSLQTNRLYWTNMGVPSENNGMVKSCQLDGSDIQTVVPSGAVHTPKQLIIHAAASKLYFCDREGLRVMRCNFDGSELEVLVQTGDWKNPEHQADQTRWCVGISVSDKKGKFYWTQKGGSKAGHGRIFCAGINMPDGKDASSRDDIECLFKGLPEPIDLEIDDDEGMLYWTDRGDPPVGNSLNKVALSGLEARGGENPKYEILAKSLHEAIGLKLDKVNRHVYTTDLGGTVYRFDMDGKNKLKLYEDAGAFSGIGLVHT